ncbi:hypothetical protein ASG85_15145 [Paenibacillus sp. Soil724D2]|nr:hypothetical protein ASG85_15145 [Paenibacillus sp. Soil724D2]
MENANERYGYPWRTKCGDSTRKSKKKTGSQAGKSCYVSRNESKEDIETGQLQIARKNLQLEGSVKQ